ncbi:MAG TPA: plastocyanin/azurin family copper-binding protein [Xanthobacteraceae bacterium]|nr:plastocyanin/azurin family copper-binding protein [Xanthobacteraceae bacterium]
MFFDIRRETITFLFAGALVANASGFASAAPKVYVGNFKDNTVSVVDMAMGKVVATIPVAAGPHGMTITRNGRWVYVAGDGSAQVSLIDTSTDKVVQTIDVGKSPHGLTLTPDGKRLLVAVNGEDRIAFVDTAKHQVVGSVPVAKPHTVAIRPDGKVAYVSSQQPGSFALVVIDLSKQTVTRTIPLDKAPRDVEFGFQGKALYYTVAGQDAVEVLNPATNKVVAEIPTGVSPHYVNWFAHTAFGLAVVQGPGVLQMFDPKKNVALGTIAVGRQPHWMTVSGDGKTAFVTNEGSNDLSIVDLASKKVETIAVGNAPRKVVVQSAAAGHAGNVSITNFAFAPGTITIKAGESVTWINNDGAPHTVTFKDGSVKSDSLLPGGTFSHVFEQPGAYDYYCSFHEFMTGRVIVQAKEASHRANGAVKLRSWRSASRNRAPSGIDRVPSA